MFLIRSMPPRRLPFDCADYARWLAGEIERRPEYSFFVTRETAAFVGMALRGYADTLDARAARELQFVTTTYSRYAPHGEVVAASRRTAMAWASFQASIPEFPEALSIVLHQGSRVLGRHPPNANDRVEVVMSNERIADRIETEKYVERARALYFLDETSILIAEPPVVESTKDGARVLAWLPVSAEDAVAGGS